jgi:predicted anti-sigma-YlaC factor YlaD
MLTPVPPTACQRAREAVSARLDGELSELGSARLAAHLRECDACAAYAHEVSAISGRLRAAPLEQPGAAVAVPMRRRRHGAVQLAAAAAAVAALGAALALSSSGPSVRTGTHQLGQPSLTEDIISQHILALERRLGPTGEVRVGQLRIL